MGKNKHKYNCVAKRKRRNIASLEKAREAKMRIRMNRVEEDSDFRREVVPGTSEKSDLITETNMDEENLIDDRMKRKRELTNARVKKYREKKRIESQEGNSLKQNQQVKENSAARKRAMSKERSRRFRERKHLDMLKSVHHVVQDSQIPGPSFENPPPLIPIKRRSTIPGPKIARTSTSVSRPLSVRADSDYFKTRVFV